MNSGAVPEERYGGFVLGAMDLALPISVLREVVRCDGLISLPCQADCVLGGVDVRGCLIPVVDLRILLGRECADLPHPCVIVIAHEARLLGLLAERITGIFVPTCGGFRRLSVATGATVIAGSVGRLDTDRPVTVISSHSLALWPHVPWVDDPVAAYAVAQDAALNGFDEHSMPLMLLRCGRIGMAVDAVAVHATLARPALRPPAVAVQACRGTLDYTGQRIPAVDLLTVCGMGRLDADRPMHAFVLELGAGFVAFLVDEIVDVVRTRADQLTPLAAYALPEPALFSGALPAAAVTAVLTARAARAEEQTCQYLLFDTAALTSSALIAALAATNTPLDARAVEPRAAAAAAASGRAAQPIMLTFDLAGECAVPLEQIVEILAHDPKSAIFDSAAPLLGFLMNRGSSMPLFCLRRLAGLASLAPEPQSRVLVVACDGQATGFVVPQVRAIEPSHWNPSLPAMGSRAPETGANPLETRSMALVGSGTAKRMLRVLDLEGVARRLRREDQPVEGDPVKLAG